MNITKAERERLAEWLEKALGNRIAASFDGPIIHAFGNVSEMDDFKAIRSLILNPPSVTMGELRKAVFEDDNFKRINNPAASYDENLFSLLRSRGVVVEEVKE